MSVNIQKLACQKGQVGIITLSNPESINALSSTMVNTLHRTLERWANDDAVCVIVVQGAGNRGLCVGGDMVSLHHTLAQGDYVEAQRVFIDKYRLFYYLHHYPKPVVALGHGYIMGSGLGLFLASRYRLLTVDAILAMPEISIGLFPDVGASWFLNRMPGRLGLFMGLTSARLGLADALRVGLADLAMHSNSQGAVIAALQQQHWSGKPAADDYLLSELLSALPGPDYRNLPHSYLQQHEQQIARLSAGADLPAIFKQLLAADINSDWWYQCMANLRSGCPVSAWLLWQQLQKAQQMSLKQALRMELGMVQECVRRPDLMEGIRARLIDKDGQAKWSFATVADVPQSVIDAHFQTEWDDFNDPMQLD